MPCMPPSLRRAMLSLFAVVAAPAAALAASPSVPAGELQWFKGNTHTHTWWSDGDSPPEIATAWYKENGYHFLVLSDHNKLAEGTKWVNGSEKKRARTAKAYEEAFGPHWVEKEERKGKDESETGTFYRLKTLAEFRTLVEEPGKFLLIPGEEISDSAENKPVHLNGVNLRELVPPQGGATVFESLQNNVNAVLEQEKKYGTPMLVHVNHPNFGWALTPEDLWRLDGERFFEVYNGHGGVRNYGDEEHLSTERTWDIMLAKRLGDLNKPIMYGMATDDAHVFSTIPGGGSNPGRGWVMVRARYLTPNHIIESLKAGDFYASTGVTLKDVRFANNTLMVEIDARPGVSYRTQFIGTPRDYDRNATTRPAGLAGYMSPQYSGDIGKVLAEITGSNASYKLTGNELYVRAKIISDVEHPNPFAKGDLEVAWTQPVQTAQSPTPGTGG